MISTKHLVLRVPRLAEEPVIAAGCCAVLAEDIIREELERLDGVDEIRIDDSTGRVELRYDPDRLEAEKVIQTLDSADYPAVDPSEADGKVPQQLPKEANT
jgi:copper chaperone CopZ